MPKVIYETTIAGFPITLERTHDQSRMRRSDLFRVTYGAQVDELLTYERAATKLGAAIMHACTCEGRMD